MGWTGSVDGATRWVMKERFGTLQADDSSREGELFAHIRQPIQAGCKQAMNRRGDTVSCLPGQDRARIGRLKVADPAEGFGLIPR